MANIDYAGLLTGISGQNQRPSPFTSPSRDQQLLGFAAKQNEALTGRLGGMFGQQQQDPVELAKTKLVGLDPTNPADQAQFIQLLNIVDPGKAAQFKQQLEAQKKTEAEKTAQKTQQKNERASFADYLELEYGDKATKLRPAVMAGSINAGNFDKVFKAEEKLNRTPKNVTYTDTNGKIQKQLVFMDTQGGTYDEKGTPIVLPDNAQLTMTGQTPTDVESGISGFSPKEAAAVRNDILNSRSQLRVLKEITSDSIDTYLTKLGKVKAWTGKNLSALKGLGGDAVNNAIKTATGVDMQEFAGEQGVLFGDLENYFNKKRHDVTGAAAAISELRELRKGILSGETSPAVAKARIVQIMQREQESIDLNFDLLRNDGLDMSSYFDESTTDTENSKQSVSKEPSPKSELSAPKMESANRVKTLLSGVDLQKESDR